MVHRTATRMRVSMLQTLQCVNKEKWHELHGNFGNDNDDPTNHGFSLTFAVLPVRTI